MKRPWQIWLTFAICVLLAVLAIVWLSNGILQTTRDAQLARSQIELEIRTRSAILQIDSESSNIIAEESARPATDYQAFSPIESAKPEKDGDLDPSDWTPSRLLLSIPFYAGVYFQYDANGKLTSPEVPEGPFRELAFKSWKYTEASLHKAEDALEFLAEYTDYDRLGRELDRQLSDSDERPAPSAASHSGPIAAKVARARTTAAASSAVRPCWVLQKLLLVRRQSVGGNVVIQGLIIDRAELEQHFLAIIGEQLPHAQFEEDRYRGQDSKRRLATLPLILNPGPLPEADDSLAATRIALAIAWVLLALAAIATAALLSTVLTLSERRAAFVSAVTHELRTPLTTFRLYTEMLADDMIKDPATRDRYFRTLLSEADRLKHLIENVLAYARLEKGNVGDRMKAVPVDELLDIATQRLAQRAEQGNLDLKNEVSEDCLDATAVADPFAVEQILFNLVDNACKYGTDGEDRRLHLESELRPDSIVLRVRDHGSGISLADQRKLFQPFRKSAKDAAHSAPGVGLGLALCRRLARQMGGDLRYEGTDQGAAFVLELPRLVA